MRNMLRIIGLNLLFLLCSTHLKSQILFDETTSDVEISYSEFLDILAENNLEYQAEKFNLSIADEEIKAAGIMPDPELSFAFFDNQEKRLELGYGFDAELTWDLELGGKRKSRINLANTERKLAEYELKEFWIDLRTEATLSYAEALKSQMIYEVYNVSYESVSGVFDVDSNSNELSHQENKFAVRSLKKEMNDAKYEWENSLIELQSFIKSETDGHIFVPQGKLNSSERLFNPADLKDNGIQAKPEFLIADRTRILADDNIKASKAERAMDLGLMIGVENNTFSRNAIAPTPGFVAIKFGVAVPLKFSNFNTSEMEIAMIEKKQADLALQSLELEFEKELTLAYRNYKFQQDQLNEFEVEEIEEVRVLKNQISEEYIKGEKSFSDVLDAEKLYREIQLEYIELLFNNTEALIELERTAGIWDIDFN